MNKLKTNKSALQRIKVTGKKKFLRRPTMQNHYNALESGNKTRAKRGDLNMPAKEAKKLKQEFPYL